FLPEVRFFDEWNSWAVPRLDQLVTSSLGLTELRQAADLAPREQRELVHAVVDMVRTKVPLVRFSDDNLTVSTHVATVISPFASLHLGAAVAHPDIDAIATYDSELARVAELYELEVVSPGIADGWYRS